MATFISIDKLSNVFIMILYIISAFSVYKLYMCTCRRKNPPLTYKISTSLGQWVVKFNPLGPQDPWYDVKKGYDILQSLYPVLPVPNPVYASTNSDE